MADIQMIIKLIKSSTLGLYLFMSCDLVQRIKVSDPFNLSNKVEGYETEKV